MSDNIHVYPAAGVPEHITEGLDCWCQPVFELPCDECEDGCWKCTDGVILLTRDEAERAERPIVIVHNERMS